MNTQLSSPSPKSDQTPLLFVPVAPVFLLYSYFYTSNHSAAAAAQSCQSCPALRPHRRQPTRLLCPWDSPGKNTGVGCHCLPSSAAAATAAKSLQSCPTLCDPIQLLTSKMIDEISDGKLTVLFLGSAKVCQLVNFSSLSASANFLCLLSRVLRKVSIRSYLKSLYSQHPTLRLLTKQTTHD